MIVFVYGFKNEVISVIKTNDIVKNKYPYITNELIVRKMVNLVLNDNNNYKLIILDGKHDGLIDHMDPTLNIIGLNPYTLNINEEFNDPGDAKIQKV